jgi:hypothetical protein
MSLDPRTLRLRRHYRAVWNSPEGRAVLEDLLRFCQLAADPFKPGAPDATAYVVGMQRVGRRICAMTGREIPEALQDLTVETRE